MLHNNQQDLIPSDALDFAGLQALRKEFLEKRAGKKDYWTSEKLISDYHRTFGQRILWKWQAVLLRLHALDWKPNSPQFLDWASGSGAASLAVAEAYCTSLFQTSTSGPLPSFSFYDQSSLATSFSKKNFKINFPHYPISEGLPNKGYTLLLSHVLSELNANEESLLIKQIQNAESVIWVESGDKETSRKLSLLRDSLRDKMNIVAPCTHNALCGALTEGNERHWCHHFAEVPTEAFTTAFWRKFSEAFEIDLRSLPFSFLVLDQKRESAPKTEVPDLPMQTKRQSTLGMPRVYKPHISLFTCSDSGLNEITLSKRQYPEDYKRFKKGEIATHIEEDASGERKVRYA